MRTSWTGVGTALVTPFTANGDIDDLAYRKLARRQVDAGIHFLVPCGTTGEAPTLTSAEKRRLVEIAIEEAGTKARVLAGAGGYSTAEVIKSVEMMEKIGAHGILSVTPYYNRPTQEGLFQHYKAIAESTALPIILYNVPGRTGCNIEPATVLRIISVVSNEIPSEMVQMVEAAERGDFAAARAIHNRILPLMQINFVESSPGPVKYAMSQMGLCEPNYRLPMVLPSEASQGKINTVLKALNMGGHEGP